MFEVDLDGNRVAGLPSGQAPGLVAALTLIVAVGAVIGYILAASGTAETPGSTIALEAYAH